MRGMGLDRVKAQTCSTARGCGKGIADAVKIRRINLDRRDGLPAMGVIRDLRAALPGQVCRGLAPRMGKLDGDRHRRPAAHALHDPAHCVLGRVVPQADIGIADAALGDDRRRLDGQDARAGMGQVAQMHQVPVCHAAFLGRILAHGCDDNAVVQRQAANGDGLEEL